ncbi:hypothetical protein I4U23_015858 [Adineta vaga]|nr:hypothetical protein I4U23_015858 [Adineta vaga]
MVTNCKFEYMDTMIDEGLKCHLCKNPFIDPVSTPCQHAFCRQCINSKLLDEPSCPECHQSLSSTSLFPMVLFVCKMLDNLSVKCVGCGQTGIKRSQFDDHIEQTCPKTLISCSAADIRCLWKGRANQLKLHEASCDYERLRTVLTELITENKTLKEGNYLHKKSNNSSVDSIGDTATMAQLKDEVNFMRDLICHRNEVLEEKIKQYPSYSSIDLRQQNLTDFDMGILVQKAIIDRQCIVLQLQANRITDRAMPLLAHGLSDNMSMTKLNLNHNPIGDNGVRLLVNVFATNRTNIEKLYLCNIQLTDHGVFYLAEMLEHNTTLKSLGIFQNLFSDHGVEELARVLGKYNTSLESLYMDSNDSITDGCVDHLIEMFKKSQSIKGIGLKQCGLSARGLRRLKQAVNERVLY